jgi:sugar lactone lactonase YvrE
MRRQIAAAVAGLLLCGAQAFAQGAGSGPVAKARATTPEIPYEIAPTPYRFPDGLYMGEGIGVSTNSKGHVFLFTRSGESRVFEFDQAGNFVKEFGKDSYGYGFAHAVHVDRYDNVWTVDEGSNLLIKYAPDGKLLMVIGKHPDPIDQLGKMPGTAPWSGANRPYSFHRPTDFGWDKDDNIYVSDGYTDARIVKYDKNGRFIKSAGKRGNPANPLEFAAPHTMAVDANGNVYVGDRGNSRVVVLDKDLNQKAVYDNVGAPWGVCVTPGPGEQFLYVSNSAGTTIDHRFRATTGEIYKMKLDGTVLGRFGKSGVAPGEFASIHQMDCRFPNTIYTAEIQGWRTQKVLLKPNGVETTSR